MVDSDLLRMLEDVANREIPCQVAYADIQKRIAAARNEQLKEDLAAVKRIPQYMVANVEGWVEGSAKTPQGDLLMTLTKASAKYVEELIPDLFPKEK